MNKKYIITISVFAVLCLSVILVPVFGNMITATFNSDNSDKLVSIDKNKEEGTSSDNENKEEGTSSETPTEQPVEGEQSDKTEQGSQTNSDSGTKKPSTGSGSNSGSAVNSKPTTPTPPTTQTPPTPTPSNPSVTYTDTRGVWISYIELNTILKGKNQATFTQNINEVFQNSKDLGLNTVYVHVHPFSDSIYPSNVFPWSYYASGQHGVSPGFDPLAIMVERAHAYGLKFHAWFNPYRISGSFSMSANNPLNWGDPNAILNINGKYSLDPSSGTSVNKVVESVKEVVRNYDVDGIQFDDYFYPTSDLSVDASKYQAYRDAGGTISHQDWRRHNVDFLVSNTYAAVKQIKPKVLFGISPQGNNSNNYNSQFANVTKWVKSSGFVDYIAPQIYWGFNHRSAAFMSKLAEWTNLVTSPSVELIFGLAPYRAGTVDNGAGAGANEWLENTNIVARQIQEIQKSSKVKGFILFSYKSLFSPSNNNMLAERENIRNVLK